MIKGLALYYFEGCPYCTTVRREMAKLKLDIELRDIHKSASHRDDLIRGGGMKQVPCLRIEGDSGQIEWMYESLDIVAYLRERFG